MTSLDLTIMPMAFHMALGSRGKLQQQSIVQLPRRIGGPDAMQYVLEAPVGRAFAASQGQGFQWNPGFARSFAKRVKSGRITLDRILVHWAARRYGASRYKTPITDRKILDDMLGEIYEERAVLRSDLQSAQVDALCCDPQHFLHHHPYLRKLQAELDEHRQLLRRYFDQAAGRSSTGAEFEFMTFLRSEDACRLVLLLEQNQTITEINPVGRPLFLKHIAETAGMRVRYLDAARKSSSPPLAIEEVENEFIRRRADLELRILSLRPLFRAN